SLAAEAGSSLEDAIPSAAGLEASFCAGHVVLLEFGCLVGRSLRVRQHGSELVLLRLVDVGGAAKLALPLRGLLGQNVALPLLAALELAGSRGGEALLGAGV